MDWKMVIVSAFVTVGLLWQTCFGSMWIAMREPAAYRRQLETSQNLREKSCLAGCNDTCPPRLPGVGCKWRCRHKCRFKIYTLRKVKRKGSVTTVKRSSTLVAVTPTVPSPSIWPSEPITTTLNPGGNSWMDSAVRSSGSAPPYFGFVSNTIMATSYPLLPIADHSSLQMAPALEQRVAEPSLISSNIPGQPTYVYHPPVWS